MKSILSILFLSITVVIGYAQETKVEHMTFKGVPIDGSLNDYVTKMKSNGFDYMGTKEGVAMLKGDFAGYKNCVIGVSTLKQKDLVSKIAVVFPENDTWSTLSNNYYYLQELLTEKYGSPSELLEKFENEFLAEDDDSKMYEVRFDNCKYYSTYVTDKGTIRLAIDHEGVSSCFVTLSFSDKVNSKIIRAKALGDL